MGQDATKIMRLCNTIVDVSNKLAHKMKINRAEGRIYLYKLWTRFQGSEKGQLTFVFHSENSAAHSNKCCYFLDCQPYCKKKCKNRRDIRLSCQAIITVFTRRVTSCRQVNNMGSITYFSSKVGCQYVETKRFSFIDAHLNWWTVWTNYVAPSSTGIQKFFSNSISFSL